MLANARTRLTIWLDRQWQHRGWFSLSMTLFSLIVLVILAIRRQTYRLFPSRIYRAPVPVIVIGNIYVGGTGKTPAVMAVVQALQNLNRCPGVISRGYGIRIGKTPKIGNGQLDPAQFGDEPALIAKETGVPVSVHPSRQLAIQTLLNRYPQVDVIVSDDGLQHIALARDIEIIVQDARGLANGWVMPAGPLRESASRIDKVDTIITQADQPVESKENWGIKQITMQLELRRFRHLQTGNTLSPADFISHVKNLSLGAAAGIGSPEKFFASLKKSGLHLTETLPLPDHHVLTPTTFNRLSTRLVVITSKDAIKCENIADDRLWVAEVEPKLSDKAFGDWLHQKLENFTHHNR